MIYRAKLIENSVWKQSKTVKFKDVTFKTRKKHARKLKKSSKKTIVDLKGPYWLHLAARGQDINFDQHKLGFNTRISENFKSVFEFLLIF